MFISADEDKTRLWRSHGRRSARIGFQAGAARSRLAVYAFTQGNRAHMHAAHRGVIERPCERRIACWLAGDTWRPRQRAYRELPSWCSVQPPLTGLGAVDVAARVAQRPRRFHNRTGSGGDVERALCGLVT